MRDFLKGTLGTVLQVVLVFLGVVLLGASCVVLGGVIPAMGRSGSPLSWDCERGRLK